MTIPRAWFETRDVDAVGNLAWVPLRRCTDEDFYPAASEITELSEYVGIATAAIELGQRDATAKIGWSDLDVGAHRSAVEKWGYSSTDVFRGWGEPPLGVNLVIHQLIEREHVHIWHLHPDLVVALDLIREGDSWFRPSEGWVEVVRLLRDVDGDPELIEIRKEFLRDYLAARGMALYFSSYRERVMVSADDPGFEWSDKPFEEEHGADRREGYSQKNKWGEHPDQFETRGCLYRTEWVEPGDTSTRVRGDPDPYVASFIVDTDGKKAEARELGRDIRWLYFDPSVASTLLRYRGANLSWFSRETGALGASRGLHFGVNTLGLITIFAKDIGRLPPWEQRLWAAHNVTPEGGVSKELFAAQMDVNPADTVAPERELIRVIERLETAFQERHGQQLLREHEDVSTLLRRAHRFRAAEHKGLLDLAKDLTRLFIERLDVDAIIAGAGLTFAKGEKKPGSLKILERLVAHHSNAPQARALMAPIFGIYDLRLADAHLGNALVPSGLKRANVDENLATPMQGRDLLQSFVDTLSAICTLLDPPAVAKA